MQKTESAELAQKRAKILGKAHTLFDNFFSKKVDTQSRKFLRPSEWLVRNDHSKLSSLRAEEQDRMDFPRGLFGKHVRGMFDSITLNPHDLDRCAAIVEQFVIADDVVAAIANGDRIALILSTFH